MTLKATCVCLPAIIFNTPTTSLGCVIQPKALVAKVSGASVRVNRISTPVVLHLELETCQVFLSLNVKLKDFVIQQMHKYIIRTYN